MRPERPAIKIEQIRDAITLRVERREDVRNAYMVYGDTDIYNIQVIPDYPYYECDCGDHIWRVRLCKHICAVLIESGDPEACELMFRYLRGSRAPQAEE